MHADLLTESLRHLDDGELDKALLIWNKHQVSEQVLVL